MAATRVGGRLAFGSGDTRLTYNAEHELRIKNFVEDLKRAGITKNLSIAGCLAVCSKESNFDKTKEDMNYSASRMREVFPSYFPETNSNLSSFNNSIYPYMQTYFRGYTNLKSTSFANKPQDIANYIYGGEWKFDNSKNAWVWKLGRCGNEAFGDGWKYRGRGYNGVTFKGNYSKWQKNNKVKSYLNQKYGSKTLVSNPELLELYDVASIVTAEYFEENVNGGILNRWGATNINNFNDILSSFSAFYNVTRGPGFSKAEINAERNSNSPMGVAFNRGYSRMNSIIAWLEDINPTGGGAGQTPSEGAINSGNNQTTDAATQTEPIEQSSKGNNDDSNNNQPNGESYQLRKLFANTFKPIELYIDVSGLSDGDKANIAQTVGFKPEIFYNSFQIQPKDVSNFRLYHEKFLPKIEVTLFDTLGVFKKSGMPGDDTKISLFVNSRSKYLKSIRMDFKILNFKEIGGAKYRVEAILDLPGIFLRKYQSFGSKTSFDALQQIAKDCGLGFVTNMNNTNDLQNWVNTGLTNREFIEKITEKSYVSDTSYQVCYVDYYYNLVYLDLSNEFKRDVSGDVAISNIGFDKITVEPNKTEIDDKVEDLILTTERNSSISVNYIDDFKTDNLSTIVSIKTGYRNDVIYVDVTKKQILGFVVDPDTADPKKSKLFRASSGDEEFFKENNNTVYTGKIDSFSDDGNAHSNLGYTSINNLRNLIEMSKFQGLAYLPKFNFNLYPFRKVRVQVINPKPTPDQNSLFDVRLTGEWLITAIEWVTTNNKFGMNLTMIKRELGLEPDEIPEDERQSDQNNFKSSSNPPIQDAQSQSQNQQAPASPAPLAPIPIPTGPTDLEYILGDPVVNNSGVAQRLVVVDGKILTEPTAKAYIAMKKDAAGSGIKLSLSSGFRPPYGKNSVRPTNKGRQISITTQQSIRADSSRWRNRSSFSGTDEQFILNAPSSSFSPATAKPGSSNHGNGIAVDLNTGSRPGTLNSNVYVWLVKNGPKYGFFRTVGSEEWHFEYYPNLINSSPYKKLANSNANRFYSDLGLDKLA